MNSRSLRTLSDYIAKSSTLPPSAGKRVLRTYQGLDWMRYKTPEPIALTVTHAHPGLRIVHWPRGERMDSGEFANFGAPARLLHGHLVDYHDLGGIPADGHVREGQVLEIPRGIILAKSHSITLHIHGVSDPPGGAPILGQREV
jgi:hypothetical protein